MVRVFRQYIPVPFLILGILEFAISAASVFLGIATWSAIGGYDKPPFGQIWLDAAIFASVLFISMVSFGLYQRRFRHALLGILVRLIMALMVASITLSMVFYAIPIVQLGRGYFISSLIITTILLSIDRILFFRSLDKNAISRRILVLGAGAQAAQISQNLRRRVDQQGFVVVGYVHVRGEHDMVDESLIIRPDVSLLYLANQLDVDEIVIAVGERRRKGFPVHDLLDCKLSGIDVIDLLGFFERETGKVKLDILNPSWMIFSDGFNQGRSLSITKRLFDIVASVALLSVAWPFMLAVVIAIKLEGLGGGSIFYRQVRVGQHWRLFNVYKFRSMREDAEKDGKAQWAKKDDDRVTKVGKFIRKTRLDELPQVFNVLKGDMSFVGPRPERPEFVTKLTEQIPYYAERHRIKPGITGWAQICYPYGASEKDSLEKLQFDLYYIKNYSLFLDIVIILQTAHSVIAGRGGR